MAEKETKTVNIRLPEAVHRTLKAAASLKGVSMESHMADILSAAAAKLPKQSAAA